MKRAIILIALILICSSFVLASNCPPSLPKVYFGQVLYNGNPLAGNYEIRAVIGLDTVGIGEVSEGNYEIDVSPCIGVTGVVKFYINGIKTKEDGSYNGMDDWGKSVNLDLSVNEMPPLSETCGDGDIQLGEECDGTNLAGRDVDDCGDGWTGTISCSANCQIDYSNCVIGDSEDDDSSGGNGGGGGSSGGGGGGGGSGGSSSSSRNTSNNEGVIFLDESGEEEEEADDGVINVGEQDTGTGLGAVIGFIKSGAGIGLGFALVILVLGTIIFITQKRKVVK